MSLRSPPTTVRQFNLSTNRFKRRLLFPDRNYVVAFYREPASEEDRRRLEKIVAFQQKNARPDDAIFIFPSQTVEWNGRFGYVALAIPQRFYFADGKITGQEKSAKWFASSKLFNRFIPDDEKGALGDYLPICQKLANAVERLHAAGFALGDLSYHNLPVSPKDRDLCILGADSLIVPGVFPPKVFGAPDFIAPEVVQTMHLANAAGRELSCRETDRHALAVLIYTLLFHRHPLHGSALYSYEADTQDRLEMGERALFIEHPTDGSNRLDPDEEYPPWNDTQAMPYTILGKPLANLFRQAFVDGLHCPSLRPSAAQWASALDQTSRTLIPCANPACVMKEFVEIAESSTICPYCRAVAQTASR